MIADLWPQATVRGQVATAGSTIEVDQDGAFSGVHYSSQRQYVPAYVVEAMPLP